MPQVPYNPNIDVKADMGTPIPSQQINASPDAFGAQVGQALQRGGSEITAGADQLGGAIMHQQDIYNAASANDLDVKAMEEMGQIQEKYYSLEGKNAVDAQAQYNQDISALRDKYRGMAPNGAAARMLDTMLTRRIGQAVVQGDVHAAQQNKAFYDGAANAKIGLSLQQAGQQQEDGQFATYTATAVDDAKALAAQKGLSPEATAVEVQKVKDQAFQSYVQGRAMTDPMRMMKFLQDNKGNLSPQAYDQLYKSTRQSAVNVGATQIARDITSGGPGGNFETQLAFGDHELTGAYKAVGDRLRTATDPVEAAKDVVLHYEQPQGSQSGVAEQSSGWADRKANAERIFNGGGTQKENQALQFYMNRGYSKAGAAGLVGNFSQESAGLQPDIHQIGGGGGYGIAQWTAADRKANLAEFAKTYVPRGDSFANATEGELGSAEQGARLQAQHMFPNDPEMAGNAGDLAAQRVRQNFMMQKGAAADVVKNNFDTLNAALYPNKGTPPTSTDELFNGSPDMQNKYNSLTPEMRAKVDQDLRANASNKDVALNPQGIDNMNKYRWMAMSNPDGYKQLSVLSDPNLTRAQKQEAVNWQIHPPQRPNTTHAIEEQMKPELNALGITMSKNPDGYNKYMGALAAQVQAEETQKGGPLDQTRQLELGRKMLRGQVVQSGFMGMYNTSTPVYQATPPAADSARLINWYKNKWGRTPTPDIVNQMYRNEQIRNPAVKVSD